MSFSKLKPVPKAILVLSVIGAIGYGVNFAMNKGYFSTKTVVASSVPDSINLPTAPGSAQIGGSVINAPTVSNVGQIRIKTIPWNGTAGLQFANGGPDTASGSLMDKRGLNVNIKREDDYAKLIADLATNAKDPSQGSHAVVIMGDGFPAFVKGANDALKPFGTSAVVIGALGYSRGEDKCIVADGVSPRGAVIAGYLGDGDINICIKYAADNGIPVNADPRTYDPNGMNFIGVGSFVEADDKFIASARNNFTDGACEERKNTQTGDRQKVCVNGTATWTPGDVKVFKELAKIGKSIKSLASTKEYAWQMPTTLVANKSWVDKNPEVVQALLAAALEGGEQVRANDQALLKAGEIQAKVYGEQDAEYWARYHRGVTETGPNGKPVALGGSTTNGLADNAFLFGLNGNDNLYKKVYTVYGGVVIKYFPDMLDKLIPYESVVDTRALEALLKNSTSVAAPVKPSFGGQRDEVVATKSYSIEFDTGKTTFKPASVAVLNELLDQIAVSSLSVQVNGHTDNVGDPTSNLTLSKKRAEAVKNFLMENASGNFPAERVVTRGFGDSQPVADNKTPAGKAQNRRVEIVLFSTK